MANATQPSLTQLAETILAAAKTIDGYLENNNLPKPSFKPASPDALPFAPEVQGAKLELQGALNDLHALVSGSSEVLTVELTAGLHDVSVLDVLEKFNFWHAVPLEGSVDYKTISDKTGLNEEAVRRVLRHAFGRRIFAETSPGSGQVIHTAVSALPAKDENARSFLRHDLNEIWPSTVNLSKALKEWNNTIEPTKTAGAYTFFKDDPSIKSFFAFMNSPGEEHRVKNFSEAMAYMAKHPSMNLDAISYLYNFEKLGDFTFVDIGGSAGHVTFMLAEKFPRLKGIVQDLPEVARHFASKLPTDLKSRVEFQGYDFFEPQPVKGADIYFLKHIIHDWSDPYAAKILKQIVPAMEPAKSRIMIADAVIPPPGAVPFTVTRLMSMMDMQMLTGLNSKERSAEDFDKLCALTDERLVVKAIHQSPACAVGLIEIELKA